MTHFALFHVRREFMRLPDEEYSSRLDEVMRRYTKLLYVAFFVFILVLWIAAVLLLSAASSWQELLKAFRFAGSAGIIVGCISLWLGVSKRLVRCAARRVYLDFATEVLDRRQT